MHTDKNHPKFANFFSNVSSVVVTEEAYTNPEQQEEIISIARGLQRVDSNKVV